MREPFVARPLLFVALAMAVFALGLIYETAERLLSPGRGIYAVAIYCSIPAVGIAATTPALMAACGIMLMTSLGAWMAVRAVGPERPYLLAMVAVLLACGGFLFGFQPASVSLLFVVWLAAMRASERTRSQTAIILGAVGVSAALVRAVFFSDLLAVGYGSFPADRTGLVFSMPWLLWPLIVWSFLRNRSSGASVPIWWIAAASCTLIGLVTALLSRGAAIIAAASSAPLIALLGADLAQREFDASSREAGRGGIIIPAVLIALIAVAGLALQATGVVVIEWLMPGEVVVAVVLSGAVLWTAVHRLARWSFALLFVCGIALGLWSRPRVMLELVAPERATSQVFIFAAVVIAATTWLLLYFTLGRRIRLPKRRDTEFRFSDTPFRVFSGGARRSVQQSELDRVTRETFAFAVFGDVTGAESPLSTRRSGFLAFREFTRVMEETPPAFAISLGDLASQAMPGAYRRLRRLLARIAVPLAVVPGNHDVFAATEYDARLFHATFGPDNSAFRLGNVDFVLLNNAWGSVTTEQFEWLERVLAPSAAPFRLVFCHKPPFDFRENAFYAMEERPHAERLHEMFVRCNVTAVISGHIHTLLAEKKDGITYLISGGGGSRLLKGEAGHHYLRVEVASDGLVVRAIPLSGKGAAIQPLLDLKLAARS